MASKLNSDDLFGGLSDSDNSDIEGDMLNVVPTDSVFQDLALSSSEEDVGSQEEEKEIKPLSSINLQVFSSVESIANTETGSVPLESSTSSVPSVSSSLSSSSDGLCCRTSSEVYNHKRQRLSDNLEDHDVKERFNTTSETPGFYSRKLDFNSTKFSSSSSSKWDTPEAEIKLGSSRIVKGSTVQKNSQSTHSKIQPHVKRNASYTRKAAPMGNYFKDETVEQLKMKENMKEEKLIRDKIVIANLSEKQLDRFAAFRRSKLNKQVVKNVVAEVTGKAPTDTLAIAISTLAKLFVGEIVEEAVELRDLKGDNDEPLLPHHITAAFHKLSYEGKLWPPYGNKS